MKTSYPVHERFYTWQGEGCHTGRAAWFIRLFGCPVHCPWCDSAGTWHSDFVPERVPKINANELAAEFGASKAEFVVITGGEPAIHDLRALCHAIHEAGLPVHIETSGGFKIRGEFDWLTLSPKRWAPPLDENLSKAAEIKIIVDETDAIAEYVSMIRAGIGSQYVPVWLHPEWSQRDDREILDAISEWVKAHGSPYRAGWQLHKLYAVDMLDPRSAKPAPLGGHPELGY